MINKYRYGEYDALSANIKTNYLTNEEVKLYTEYLYDRFKDPKWIIHNNILKGYPIYYIKLIKSIFPMALLKLKFKLNRKSDRDFFLEMARIKADFRNLKL